MGPSPSDRPVSPGVSGGRQPHAEIEVGLRGVAGMPLRVGLGRAGRSREVQSASAWV